jgi:hypothetical protein
MYSRATPVFSLRRWPLRHGNQRETFLIAANSTRMTGHQFGSSRAQLNPFNDKDAPDGKTTILDIKARDETGRQFNVEMQMLAFGAFRQRALYYWARLHQGQLKKGKDFRVLRPTIAVCFIDTPLFPDIADYPLPLSYANGGTKRSLRTRWPCISLN